MVLLLGLSTPSARVMGAGNNNTAMQDQSAQKKVFGSGIGKHAYDFTLQDIAGNTHSLSDYLSTNIVLIDFWATWCNPCHTYMPITQKLHNKYQNKGLKILAVSADGDPVKARDYIAHHEYTFTVLVETNNWTQGSMSLFDIPAIPSMVLIDKDGIIRFNSHPRYLTPEIIEQYLP